MKKRKNQQKMGAFNYAIMAVLILHTFILFLLLGWSLSTALKSQDCFDKSFWGLPDFDFGNFVRVIENFNFVTTRDGDQIIISLFPDIIVDTLLYTVGCAFLSALVPCLVAYVVAKFDCSFSKILYSIVIITMIVPIIGNQPSMISVLMSLNLYDNIIGAWVMRANFLGMFFLIFVANFKNLPDGYREAAYIDGASEWKVLLKIMLPLVKTAFFTVMLIQFIDCWNDYNTPLLYLPSHYTISYGVYVMSNTVVTGLSTAPIKMAACAIMIIPTVILFICFKEKLMGNLSMGGIKG